VHLDANLLGLEPAHPDAGLGLQVHGDGELAGLLDVGARRGGIDRERGRRDGGLDDGDVAGVGREPGHGRLAERDGVGGRGGRHGEVVVEVDELLVGVLGRQRHVDGVAQRGRRGGRRQAQLRHARHGQRERRAVRAVQEVEGAAHHGGQEGEEEDDEHRPEEAAAAAERAGPPASAPALRGRLLWPVDGPLVHLGRAARSGAVAGRCRCRGLRGGLAVGRHCSALLRAPQGTDELRTAGGAGWFLERIGSCGVTATP